MIDLEGKKDYKTPSIWKKQQPVSITGTTAGQERERDVCYVAEIARCYRCRGERRENKHVAQTPVGLGLKRKMT